MIALKRLNEIFNHALDFGDTKGFFYYLDEWALNTYGSDEMYVEMPWLEGMSVFLDLMYHGNRSGNKIVSPLVANLLNNEPIDPLNPTRAKIIAGTWYSTYAQNLKRQWEVMLAEYDPITNYSMEEDGTDSKTGNDTLTYSGIEIKTKSGIETTIKQGEEYTEKSGTEKQTKKGFETKIIESDKTNNYGFDTSAADGSPVQYREGTEITGFTHTPTGETAQDRTDEIEFDNRKDTISYGIVDNGVDKRRKDITSFGLEQDPDYSSQDTRVKESVEFGTGNDARKDTTTYGTTDTHHLERSGNIGVTTSQQMLESEIALWQWNFYTNYLFPTVDKTLTIPIY